VQYGQNQKTRNPSNTSDEGEASNSDKLDAIFKKLAGLDAIALKLSKLESAMTAIQAENRALKATINEQQSTIVNLKTKLNSLEQNARSFFVRVNNMSLDGVDERDHSPSSARSTTLCSCLLTGNRQ
jgi:chromosome segregation ATPase